MLLMWRGKEFKSMKERESDVNSVAKKYLTTALDGKKYEVVEKRVKE